MYLFYVDGSADHHYYTFSAIGVPETNWVTTFGAIKDFRKSLREQHGVLLRKELHAWKFLSGRGRPSTKFLSKQLRADIFRGALNMLAALKPQGVVIINSALGNEDWAFERILNRINTAVGKFGTKALLICDEGKEEHYTTMCRRLRAHNPIPSKFGAWATGKEWKSIPASNIIEDPVFKQSHRSNFIQMADFCAFALLRMDKPTTAMRAIGIDQAFPLLDAVCLKAANPRDKFGVSR